MEVALCDMCKKPILDNESTHETSHQNVVHTHCLELVHYFSVCANCRLDMDDIIYLELPRRYRDCDCQAGADANFVYL